ncbi:hypothetical protein HPG69_009270 [Diceros bicornis minor]|uniref:Graves disease carrier protein n=1 Tax=Diceros bicornis minor TaxID=77932 RepID=A0A7J7FJR4_DICBM|nr:hypothetical protein HPG69_009270 [Diceros bicornis minor]
MMAAAAALAAADPPPAMPGAGGPTARRDFYWLRSFLAGGIAGCCAKTTVAPLDRVKVLLQAHNHHYKHLGVFSTLRAVPQKEGYLGLYKGNGAMMIRIFPYGAIQFMAFEHYKTLITTKLGVSGHVHRLMAGSMAAFLNFNLFPHPTTTIQYMLNLSQKKEKLETENQGEDILLFVLDCNCKMREEENYRHRYLRKKEIESGGVLISGGTHFLPIYHFDHFVNSQLFHIKPLEARLKAYLGKESHDNTSSSSFTTWAQQNGSCTEEWQKKSCSANHDVVTTT